MIAVVLGCLWNMVFDYLFVWVFQWGLVGASVATLFGQAITLIVLLIFLGKKKAITFKVPKGQFITIAKDIIIIGLAPFGLSTIPNVSIVILNKATLFYGGEEGLGAYGCIAYLTFIVLLMLQGVGDGAQPLISTYYGKDDFSSLKKLRKYTYIFSLTIALVSMVIEIKLRWKLGPFMGTSSNTTTIVAKALPIFAIAFPLQGIIRATSSILYSTEKALRSYLITYSEPIFILLAIIILCPYFALDGVWFAFTAGQCALMIMSLIL
ncbi:MAG: hypothetical protein HUK24_07930 [Sphaerochaetaceae bacterium]|nr:hypothetical protein [Sphaerochaetaceae bacterium]